MNISKNPRWSWNQIPCSRPPNNKIKMEQMELVKLKGKLSNTTQATCGLWFPSSTLQKWFVLIQQKQEYPNHAKHWLSKAKQPQQPGIHYITNTIPKVTSTRQTHEENTQIPTYTTPTFCPNRLFLARVYAGQRSSPTLFTSRTYSVKKCVVQSSIDASAFERALTWHAGRKHDDVMCYFKALLCGLVLQAPPTVS